MRRTIALLMLSLVISAVFLTVGVVWMQAVPSPVAARVSSPAGVSTAARPPLPTATVVCPSNWTVVPSPNSGPAENELRHLAVVSENDIWAVGTYSATGGLRQTLTQHWDGAAWSIVPSPNRPGVDNWLYGVAARTTDDVWAVGAADPTGATPQTLIEHWNGTAWTRVPSPNPGTTGPNILYAVTVLAADDVWAVGSYNLGTPLISHTLTLHWDGTNWTQVSTPTLPNTEGDAFYGVNALAANDVWAVGYAASYNRYGTLIEHWDGLAWTRVASPNLATVPGDQPLIIASYLRAVTMITATDGWAVGGNHDGDYALILHWDGTSWSIVQPYWLHGQLNDVVVRGPSDVWAVGQGRDLNAGVLVLHWDGLSWASSPAPNPSAEDNIAYGVAATGGGDLWLVGTAGPSTAHQTLIERNPPCVGGPPTATPTPNCATGWNPVTSPNIGSPDTDLNGVTVVAPDDVWAAGQDGLILHWDGVSWGVVPAAPAAGLRFNAIAATAADDVWAVGTYLDGIWERTLAEHWDGSAWSISPSPNPQPGDDRFYAVTAIAPDNVWAVGIWGPGGPVQTLVEHWDGVQWSVVPSPNVPQISSWLLGVTARGPNDIWAVGYSDDFAGSNVLIEHWDGTTWTISPTPNYTSRATQLHSVTALASNDVWVVGQFVITTNTIVYQTLALHWDGTQWARVNTPSPGTYDWLNEVTALAPDNVWAVGQSLVNPPLIEHWDGVSWQIVAAPPRGRDVLYAIAAVSPEDIWAVGQYFNGAVYRTLTDHYTGPCATPTGTATPTPEVTTTPTPSPTRTAPPTYTSSPFPLSQTPVPTSTPFPSPTSSTATPPTVCALAFVDVPPGSTFYDYVRCLSCRGIVGGYPCGGPGEPCPGSYYRPNNNVTRGQAAKLVSSSAAFTDPIPSSQQTFADVGPGSTFHLWVERLAGRGLLGGYPCGGPGEPCIAPANQPYFRPTNNVTRGQLAKITSGAAGYSETPTGQTFADVPPGSTFYLPIERLAGRGIMSGYPCGGPTEPCISPMDQPYFRPGNPATRGQAAKIIANTFLSNCATPAVSHPPEQAVRQPGP